MESSLTLPLRPHAVRQMPTLPSQKNSSCLSQMCQTWPLYGYILVLMNLSQMR